MRGSAGATRRVGLAWALLWVCTTAGAKPEQDPVRYLPADEARALFVRAFEGSPSVDPLELLIQLVSHMEEGTALEGRVLWDALAEYPLGDRVGDRILKNITRIDRRGRVVRIYSRSDERYDIPPLDPEAPGSKLFMGKLLKLELADDGHTISIRDLDGLKARNKGSDEKPGHVAPLSAFHPVRRITLTRGAAGAAPRLEIEAGYWYYSETLEVPLVRGLRPRTPTPGLVPTLERSLGGGH